jgi:tetratricopeptide (TPR) repeat protein
MARSISKFAWLTVLWGLMAVPAAPSSQELARADALLRENRLEEAIALLKPLAESEPAPVGVDARLGRAYYEKRDYHHALQHLERARRQSPDDGEIIQLLGLAYYLHGRTAQAIPLLEEILGKLPHPDVTGAYVLGVSYLQTQQWDKARHAFARMFSVAEDSAAAYLVLGQMMMRQTLEDAAVPQLQKALELDPRIPMARFLLGEIYLFRGNARQALEEFRKELELNPIQWAVYWRMGDAYDRLENIAEAERALKQAIWLNQNFTGPYILMGKVLLKKKDPELAANFLERAVKMDPNNYLTHYLLGQAYRDLGRVEDANKHFELTRTLRDVR